MGDAPYIPQKTVEEMAASHPEGTRHAAMFKIAVPLIGNGMAPDAVFAQLRATFPDADKTDKEIHDVIRWVIEKNPQPSGYGPRPPQQAPRVLSPRPPAQPLIPATEKAAWWLGGFTVTVEGFVAGSPIEIPAAPQEMTRLALTALYAPGECVNVVRAYTVNEKGKANPQGAGKSQPAEKWIAWISQNGLPHDKAGSWVRPNPTAAKGSGKEGAIMDVDIAAFRFILIESDKLTVETQLSLYAKFKLPIALVVTSGGGSCHAWVRVDCRDKDAYREIAAKLIGALQPFGFDAACKNPSRLSRLPGATRHIQAEGDGLQRLLYLNPTAPALTPATLAEFETQLSCPLIDEKPFKALLYGAITRYQNLYENRGKLGVPTGIKGFDEITGGLKNKHVIVVAAQTGGGKTTLAMNMINAAAFHRDIGVALFTLEMDKDEICDLMVAMNCSVDRNVFNTGAFTEWHFQQITAMGKRLSDLPLWVFDDPVMTMTQIRERSLQLAREKKIGLIVIDYIQFVSAGESFRDNREQQIASISRSIKALAKEANVPIVALSQLNDEGKIRESRVVAHDANIVMIVEDDGQDFMVKVVKGRSIPKGQYPMRFERQFSRLSTPEHREPKEHPNHRKR